MRAIIRRSRVSGKVRAPQSKSYAIRLVFSSLFTDVELESLSLSEDVVDAINAVSVFGVAFSGGRFLRPSRLAIYRDSVYVKASATVLRMFIPIAAVVGGRILVDGGETLRRRPIKAVVNALMDRGVKFSRDCLPTVMEGRLRDNYVEIAGHESSQYVSGFMIAFAVAGGGTIKIRPPIVSQSYIELTAEVLRALGVDVKIGDYRVEVDVAEKPRGYRGNVPGDFLLSSFYVASALLTSGYIEVYNLSRLSGDGDYHKVVDVYRDMGAYSVYFNGVWYAHSSDSYRGVEVNVVDDPDLALSVIPIASVARGLTVLRGVSNLRIKESDRVESAISMLKGFGIEAYADRDTLNIVGGEPSESTAVCPEDHRIAMAFASIAVRSGGAIDRAECVNKSNPGFWSDLRSLGADIELTTGV